MLDRLPSIYGIGTGSLVYALLAHMGNFQSAYDEDMQRVQRSHWVDTALDRDDLAKLGALMDIEPLPWEPADLYRTRLKATIRARLRGAVTRPVLEELVTLILNGVLASLGTKYMKLAAGARFRDADSAGPGDPAFIEFTRVLRRSPELTARRGLLRSLDKVTVVNRGVHPVPLQMAVRGVAGGLCLNPVIVNLTNGNVVLYVGDVPCGHELSLETDARGRLRATLQGEDVARDVYTGRGFTPGAQFSPVLPDATPEPLMLERGTNQIWFFPLALFNRRSLGSGVFGMPAEDLVHGLYGVRSGDPAGTLFDHSLYEQPAATSMDFWWVEDEPANFRIEVPAGVVTRDADGAGDAHAERLGLFELLQNTVANVRAAGVDGRVEPRPLRGVQPQRDLVRVLPAVIAREQLTMQDRLGALSAIFDVTAGEGSRFT
jgi:hypothetical protein